MIKRLYILVLFAVLCVCAHAETLLLRTGARVKGTIVFQNEEVVVIRDESGARFQYMRADVETVLSDEEQNEPNEPVNDQRVNDQIENGKKASILLELGGGSAVIPGEPAGGAFSVDLLVGSHHIGDKHLFVGGGLGYHGLFIGGEKYNFLPLQVAVRMPFTESKHAPVFGAALGYGIALSKDYVGGIYAGIDLGYRCQLNPKTALAIVAYTQFQQAQVTVVETVDSQPYEHRTGRNLVVPGVKLALYF